MNEETINHVISLVKQHGTNCWFTLPIEDLLPAKFKDQAPKLRKVRRGGGGGKGGKGGE
jgi:isoleucyl-tRNA synthetase